MTKVIIEFRRRSQIFSMRAFGVMCLQVYRASRMGKGSCHWEPWWEVADPVHLEMGALRVSLDRKVRSGIGSLTSQAEQFDFIMLAREDAEWPWQRVLWLSLRLGKLPLTGKRNWGSEIPCIQLIPSLTILRRLASETLVSCRAPRKLAPFEC